MPDENVIDMVLSAEHRAEAARIAAELAAIAGSGHVLAGSIIERRTRCGRPTCRCMADPPQPHGPYFQWTRKLRAKTVGRWLTADQHEDYRSWVANSRRIHALVARLEELGAEAVEADSRSERGDSRRARPRA